MASRKQIINPFWFALPDFIWMLLSLGLAITIKYGDSASAELTTVHYRIFFPIFLAWLVVLFVHNLFDPKSLRRYVTLVFSLVSATFFCFVVAVVYFYFQPALILTPRRFLLLLTLIWFVLSTLWHVAMKLLLQNRIIEEFYLFSPGNELDEVHKEILKHSYLGFRTIKYVTDSQELARLANKNVSIIVAEQSMDNPAHAKIIYDLRARGAEVTGQIDFSERLLRRVPLEHLNEPWLLRNIWIGSSRLENFARRLADVLVGLLFGVLFVVTFPLIAAAIKILSRGPLFFVQDRVGKSGKIFMVYKYRTMVADSTGRGWTKINDPRVTPIGKFLRRAHLDELPQFVNLINGSMSIVGPRPEQSEIVDELRKTIPFYEERHFVKPGLTGWSQLNIYAGTLEESKLKLEYDLYYLKHRSLLFDLEIILKTIYSIFVNKL